MRSKLCVVVIAVAITALAPATVAGAGDPRFDNTGGGAFPTVSNFSDITLNGLAQLTTATINPFVVVDDSGSLAGWNVTLLFPDLKNGTGGDCATGSTQTLSAASLAMNAPSVAAGSGGDLTGVTGTGYTDFRSGRIIVDAAAGHGAGSYAISPAMLTLLVPGSALAGTYCTQATIAIASGP